MPRRRPWSGPQPLRRTLLTPSISPDYYHDHIHTHKSHFFSIPTSLPPPNPSNTHRPPGPSQPLGYSRKFWYTPTLSTTTSISSITSPAEPSPNQGPNQKRLWLDPHQLPLLLEGRRRVALIDDAVSSGSTLLAAWQLLETLGVDVVVCGVAMKQGSRWRETLGEERAGRLVGVFDSPLLEAVPQGWTYRT